MKTIFLALAIALTACTTTTPDMPRTQACQEQATAWCATVAPTAQGCEIVYRNWCGMDGTVNGQDQEACLDAVATMQRTWDGSWPVPVACSRTWAVAPPWDRG